jgi:hypothetical protein
MGTGLPDLMTVLANFSASIPPIIMMLQAFASVIGLYLVSGALVDLWGASNENAIKYIASSKRFTVGGAMVQLVIGGLMAAMGTLQLVGVLTRTFTDDYVNSRFMSYSPGSTFDEQRLAAMAALLGIMQIVGFVAMVKGWLTINRHYNGQSQVGLGVGAAWLIGGVAAWNFKWVSDVLNCSVGFNIIGMFSASFGMANSCGP